MIDFLSSPDGSDILFLAGQPGKDIAYSGTKCYCETFGSASEFKKKNAQYIKDIGRYIFDKIFYELARGFLCALMIKKAPMRINGILSHCPVENKPNSLSKPP